MKLMEFPNLPKNWDMLLFIVGWLSVFFAPQQNKLLMMFGWFLIITGMVLGIINYVDFEYFRRTKTTGNEAVWFTIIIVVIWICALGGFYKWLFPLIYPNLI